MNFSISLCLALIGTLFLFGLARTLGTWRWSAFEAPSDRPTRVAATLEPPDRTLAGLTNEAMDSVPQGLEPRPAVAAAAPEEPEAALGDIKPKAAAAKRQKPAVRTKARLSTIGLGKARQTLMTGEAPDFDGGGSGAFASEESGMAPVTRAESSRSAAAPPAERPTRSFRGVLAPRAATATPPPQTHSPPAYEGESSGEPESE